MADLYRSSFTGPDFDNTVSSALFDITVNGASVPKNNHTAEITMPLYSVGTWTPAADNFNDGGGAYTPPTVNYEYREGQYTRFGDLCFINFYLKFTITPTGDRYATIINLPYRSATNIRKQTISVCDMGAANWLPAATVTFQINQNSTEIRLEQNDGIYALKWPENFSEPIYIAGSGVYKIMI